MSEAVDTSKEEWTGELYSRMMGDGSWVCDLALCAAILRAREARHG